MGRGDDHTISHPATPGLRWLWSDRSLILPALLVLAYPLLVTFTPNMQALDTAATRFLLLSLLNILAFGILLIRHRDYFPPALLPSLYRSPLALAYSAFLLVALLSFTQAINPAESLLRFAKLFSIFSAAGVLWVLLLRDIRFVYLLVVVMSLLLLADALSVFYQIARFIQGEFRLINDITTIYSNKNVLTAALFVKLPFALVLLYFDRGLLRFAGWLALFFGMLAILLLAARAFYLGLLVLSPLFLLYFLFHYLLSRQRRILHTAAAYLLALGLAFGLHALVQEYMYPDRGRHTQSVPAQLAIINVVVREDTTYVREEDSTWDRLDAWHRSARRVTEKPLLGVGLGNWKVDILQYENQHSPHFLYMYKAHNDFLEHAVETGIPGGLLFISVFLLMGWQFVQLFRARARAPDLLFLAGFLAVAGLASYAVDAFFNFPAARPAIGILWAIFLAAGIAAAVKHRQEESQYGKDDRRGKAGREWEAGRRGVDLGEESGRAGEAVLREESGLKEKASLIGEIKCEETAGQKGEADLREELCRAGEAEPEKKPGRPGRFHRRGKPAAVAVATLLMLMMVGSLWLLQMNYRSAKVQRLSVQDVAEGRLGYGRDLWIGPLGTWTIRPELSGTTDPEAFPAIPNITFWGESVDVLKARYLVEEGRYREAIGLLQSDRVNPWDSRREYVLARVFQAINEPDSALYYAREAHRMKPFYPGYEKFLKELEGAKGVLPEAEDR